jgi:23S rRNA (cytidine1920-2'-O)/16S rRNA (cytidine1409-2'-O)-methyltransferase
MLPRADTLLVERGFFESRAKARAAIEAGLVRADGQVVAKPAANLAPDARIEASAPHPWVSRAGLKLVAGLDAFGFDPAGQTCLDIGASTGGFTQVLLSRRAVKVFAVDVGHGQLHAILRDEPRVVSLEGVDARRLDTTTITPAPQMIVCDASFISLTLILSPVLALAAPGAALVALIKPQFEAGRGRVKKGVVRDAAVHEEVCETARRHIETLGWRVLGVVPSPIDGGDGNREFLLGAVHAS